MSDGHASERDDILSWLEASVQSDPEARRVASEEEVHLHLARALRRARLAAGMTQSQVAEASGLRQSAVSRLESPNHNPTVASVVRYLTAVGGELAATVLVGQRQIAATPAAQRTVTLPEELTLRAEARGMNLAAYVVDCLARETHGATVYGSSTNP